MRTRGAKAALVGGLVAAVVAILVGSATVANAALVAALVLLPAAVVAELVRREGSAHLAPLVAGLFVTGVLVFADEAGLAKVAFAATVALLLAIGFAEGHLRAILWAVVVLLSAITADLLWWFDWDPFDRDADYEPLAQAPFVLIGLPIPMAVVAVGVAARRLLAQVRRA